MSSDASLEQDGATVSLTALAPFLRLLEEAGPEIVTRTLAESERVFARWGVTTDDLDQPTVRLPHGLMVELLHEFSEILGDPSAPLRAGQKLRPGDYELLEYLCGSCATLGDSIACLARYYPLLIAAEHELRIVGERAEAHFRIAPGLAAPPSLYEFALASNFTMSILHVDWEGAKPPIEICFAHRAPAHAACFSQVFGAPVRFEAGYNAIVFPVEMLSQRLRSPDPILHAILTRLANAELAALSDQNAFPAKVRRAIEAELARGAPLGAVAARLHISPSTLRSRLRRYATSYSALLDRLRRERAKRALADPQLGIAEVAHSLGFAHPPAFHRAFRRWFGVTPQAYRAAPSSHPASRFFRKRT